MFLLVLAVWITATECPASLEWKQRTFTASPDAHVEEVIANFEFTNTGETAVTILNLTTSCNCTVADASQRVVAPGESGSIKATLAIQGRMGILNRVVTVFTDDPAGASVDLTLHVSIPERLTYSGHMVHWAINGSPNEQSVEVAAASGNVLHAITVASIAPANVEGRIEPAVDGKTYRIFLRPTKLDTFATCIVTLSAHFADGTERTFSIYALVR